MCFALRVWGSVYFDTLCFLKINARVKKIANKTFRLQMQSAASKPGGDLQQSNVAFSACLGPEWLSAQSSGHLQSNFLFKTQHFSDRLAIGCFACVYVGWEMG